MRAAVKPLVLLILLVAAGACASARQQPGTEEEEASVRVENQSFLDMTVYVLRGSQRIRLGMVPGVSTRVFPIPSNLVFGATPLRFLVDPVGSDQTPISHEITVYPGDEVDLIIPNI